MARWSKEDWKNTKATVLVFVLIILFFVLALAPRIFIFVDAGEAAVLFRRLFGGVDTTRVYGEGLHIIFPWDYMAVYDTRVQEQSSDFEVLSENGLTLRLSVSARFHPAYDTLGLLHQRIGPDYLHKVVGPVVEAAVRDTAGEYRADEVYSSQGPILYEINNRAARELSQNFIVLDRILIKSVKLPEFIARAVEDKEQQRELLQSYSYRLRTEKEEAVRKQIEAFGWSSFNTVVSRSLTPSLLQWRGIEATEELANSPNTKIVITGNTKDSLPVILGGDVAQSPGPAGQQQAVASRPSDLGSPEQLANNINRMRDTLQEIWVKNLATIGSVDRTNEDPTGVGP